MKIDEVYGTKLKIKEAKNKLENLCSVKFEERDSLYFGTYYSVSKDTTGEIYKLYNNIDPFDNKPLENFDFPVILFVSNISTTKNQLIKNSEFFQLLSHKEL
ncbi:hypothetical protein [Psychrobacter sp. I-STPA6b]|uniref:hypothetical protein n=1 Tax=Psychrobacter sp. I-STPA6b TaxID=2585718 RepID=UPI001D0C2C16|nr:hypothetical protein [Psychrobacter sp. I-STPA6b]